MSEIAPRYPQPVQARVTIRGVLLLQLAANGAGAAAVVVYLYVLFPRQLPGGDRQLGLNLLLFGGYLLATLFVALPINRRFLMHSVGWLREGRPPTEQERKLTLHLPRVETLSALLGWVSAAIAFGALNDDVQRVAVGIFLAGLITCSLLYLLLERHFRPVFAMVLADQDVPGRRREVLTRLMLAWWIGSAIPLLAIGLAPLTTPQDRLLELNSRFTVLAVLIVAGGGLLMRAAASGVSVPVDEVRAAMARVEEGDLDAAVPVTNTGEIGELQAGFNRMVTGLRERRRLQDLFGRQVGTDVARRALEEDPALGGEEREITALFVDLVDFTGFTQTHTPAEVVGELNDFFDVVIRVVMSEGGFVNKFEGDAALCVFGAPNQQPEHAERALRAAARLRRGIEEIPGAPAAGIGVATGRAVAGYVGAAERYEYTVIGDAVNVAARLSELAKGRAVPVLVSADTVRAAARTGSDGDGRSTVAGPPCPVGWGAAGSATLRGRITPLELFQPV